MHLMDVGDSYSNEDFTVKMYGSTDAGGSFLIHCHGITIFHAGDLNWWHWAGDSDAANLDARNNYFAELEKLSGEKWISPCSRWMLDSGGKGVGR